MAEHAVGNAPVVGGGVLTPDPAADEILATSGVLPYAGIYEVVVICGADVDAVWDIARRNAANDDDVSVFSVNTGPAQSQRFVVPLTFEVGERLVVRAHAANAGQANCVFLSLTQLA